MAGGGGGARWAGGGGGGGVWGGDRWRRLSRCGAGWNGSGSGGNRCRGGGGCGSTEISYVIGIEILDIITQMGGRDDRCDIHAAGVALMGEFAGAAFVDFAAEDIETAAIGADLGSGQAGLGG